MKRWLAHYDVSSEVDLVGSVQYRHPAHRYEIAIANGDLNTFACKMVFDAADFEKASVFAEAESQTLVQSLRVKMSCCRNLVFVWYQATGGLKWRKTKTSPRSNGRRA